MFFKESVVIAFIASQAWAAPAPVVKARAETSTYPCNPAHSYPNGATCDLAKGGLVTPAPTATTSSAYLCNPAHSYPEGVTCDATARTLVTSVSSAATTTTYPCNPAHSYPNGATCDLAKGGLVTPAPSTSTTTYPCNPAHSYPNGATCDLSKGGLVTPAPLSTTTTYPCNPAHSYPNGATCDLGKGGLVTPAPSSTATTYPCNPAHSYPNGATCDLAKGGLVTPAPSQPAISSTLVTQASAKPSQAASAGKCPLDLKAGSFEYPHLLEINGVNGYFGGVNRTTKTSFTFDIPAADAGKDCNTYFALPAKGTMETSDYTLTMVDGAHINVDGESGNLASFIPEENKSWLVYSQKCPAGKQVKYTMSTGDSIDLSWFQDYNPCAVGLFITVS